MTQVPSGREGFHLLGVPEIWTPVLPRPEETDYGMEAIRNWSEEDFYKIYPREPVDSSLDRDDGLYFPRMDESFETYRTNQYRSGICQRYRWCAGARELNATQALHSATHPALRPGATGGAFPERLHVPGQVQLTPGVPLVVWSEEKAHLQYSQTVAGVHTASTLNASPGTPRCAAEILKSIAQNAMGFKDAADARDRVPFYRLDGLRKNMRNKGSQASEFEGSYSLAWTAGEGQGSGNVQPAVQTDDPYVRSRQQMLVCDLGQLVPIALRATLSKLEFALLEFRGLHGNVIGFGHHTNRFATSLQMNISFLRIGVENGFTLVDLLGKHQGCNHVDPHDCTCGYTVFTLLCSAPEGSDIGPFVFPECGAYAHSAEKIDGIQSDFGDVYAAVLVFKGQHLHGGLAPRAFWKHAQSVKGSKIVGVRVGFVAYPNGPAVNRTGTFAVGPPNGFATSLHLEERRTQERNILQAGLSIFGTRRNMVEWLAREYSFSAYNMFATADGAIPFWLGVPYSVREMLSSIFYEDEAGNMCSVSTDGILDPALDHDGYIRMCRLFAWMKGCATYFSLGITKASVMLTRLEMESDHIEVPKLAVTDIEVPETRRVLQVVKELTTGLVPALAVEFEDAPGKLVWIKYNKWHQSPNRAECMRAFWAKKWNGKYSSGMQPNVVAHQGEEGFDEWEGIGALESAGMMMMDELDGDVTMEETAKSGSNLPTEEPAAFGGSNNGNEVVRPETEEASEVVSDEANVEVETQAEEQSVVTVRVPPPRNAKQKNGSVAETQAKTPLKRKGGTAGVGKSGERTDGGDGKRQRREEGGDQEEAAEECGRGRKRKRGPEVEGGQTKRVRNGQNTGDGTGGTTSQVVPSPADGSSTAASGPGESIEREPGVTTSQVVPSPADGSSTAASRPGESIEREPGVLAGASEVTMGSVTADSANAPLQDADGESGILTNAFDGSTDAATLAPIIPPLVRKKVVKLHPPVAEMLSSVNWETELEDLVNGRALFTNGALLKSTLQKCLARVQECEGGGGIAMQMETGESVDSWMISLHVALDAAKELANMRAVYHFSRILCRASKLAITHGFVRVMRWCLVEGPSLADFVFKPVLRGEKPQKIGVDWVDEIVEEVHRVVLLGGEKRAPRGKGQKRRKRRLRKKIAVPLLDQVAAERELRPPRRVEGEPGEEEAESDSDNESLYWDFGDESEGEDDYDGDYEPSTCQSSLSSSEDGSDESDDGGADKKDGGGEGDCGDVSVAKPARQMFTATVPKGRADGKPSATGPLVDRVVRVKTKTLTVEFGTYENTVQKQYEALTAALVETLYEILLAPGIRRAQTMLELAEGTPRETPQEPEKKKKKGKDGGKRKKKSDGEEKGEAGEAGEENESNGSALQQQMAQVIANGWMLEALREGAGTDIVWSAPGLDDMWSKPHLHSASWRTSKYRMIQPLRRAFRIAIQTRSQPKIPSNLAAIKSSIICWFEQTEGVRETLQAYEGHYRYHLSELESGRLETDDPNMPVLFRKESRRGGGERPSSGRGSRRVRAPAARATKPRVGGKPSDLTSLPTAESWALPTLMLDLAWRREQRESNAGTSDVLESSSDAAERFFTGRHPTDVSASTGRTSDQMNPVLVFQKTHKLLETSIPAARIREPKYLKNLVLALSTGQSERTYKFLEHWMEKMPSNAVEMHALYDERIRLNEQVRATFPGGRKEKERKDAWLAAHGDYWKVSDMGVYGSASEQYSFDKGKRIDIVFGDTLDKWLSALLETHPDPGEQVSWTEMGVEISRWGILPFTGDGLGKLHLQHHLARRGLCRRATVVELGQWINLNRSRGAYRGLSNLAFGPLWEQNAIVHALQMVHDHLEVSLPPEVRIAMDFGPALAENFLCKVSRTQTELEKKGGQGRKWADNWVAEYFKSTPAVDLRNWNGEERVAKCAVYG
ncbi:hypothetical protein EXIGLDRAFT_775207 [Exidia glandulosa HHB12029]|uniref:Uncharacterized protein n=1 Tax=Exidia glandulosa HHB12029 TaxID=1314781 RepID=A0A165E0C3_EXIGL|nr:hypothetical protein EXIGLDRAFT_775207 [Exidia glandulosa HHB12029]